MLPDQRQPAPGESRRSIDYIGLGSVLPNKITVHCCYAIHAVSKIPSQSERLQEYFGEDHRGAYVQKNAALEPCD